MLSIIPAGWRGVPIKETFLDGHAAFSPYIAPGSICARQDTALSCRQEQTLGPLQSMENPHWRRMVSKAGYSFVYMSIIMSFWLGMYIHIYTQTRTQIYMYKPTSFQPCTEGSSFSHQSTLLVSGTFHLIFTWSLLTRYSFSRQQTTNCARCSSPAFHTHGASSQRRAAIPPRLVPLLSSALSAKPQHIYPLPSPPGLFSLPSLGASLSFDVRLFPSPL